MEDVVFRMKVNLPDPLALACFDTSASGSCCSRTGSEGFSNRLPSSLFVADEFTPTPEQTGMLMVAVFVGKAVVDTILYVCGTFMTSYTVKCGLDGLAYCLALFSWIGQE